MPPFLSLRSSILSRLVTALQFTAGNEYFFTMQRVERMSNAWLQNVLATPACVILEGTELVSERGSMTALGQTERRLEIEVHFIHQAQSAEASEIGNKLLHDIEKALKTVDGIELEGASGDVFIVQVFVKRLELPLFIATTPKIEGAILADVVWEQHRRNPSSAQPDMT